MGAIGGGGTEDVLGSEIELGGSFASTFPAVTELRCSMMGGMGGPGVKGTLSHRLIRSPNGKRVESQPRFTINVMLK